MAVDYLSGWFRSRISNRDEETEPQTVRDWMSRWVHKYFSEVDPVSDLDVLTDDLVRYTPYTPDRECTDEVRKVLTECFHEPRVEFEQLVEEELARAVSDEFAAIMLPHAIVTFSEEWSVVDDPETEVPFMVAEAIRGAYRQAAREGQLDPFVGLYEEGDLEEHLQNHGAAQSG